MQVRAGLKTEAFRGASAWRRQYSVNLRQDYGSRASRGGSVRRDNGGFAVRELPRISLAKRWDGVAVEALHCGSSE
jgi:hypothetical protein